MTWINILKHSKQLQTNCVPYLKVFRWARHKLNALCARVCGGWLTCHEWPTGGQFTSRLPADRPSNVTWRPNGLKSREVSHTLLCSSVPCIQHTSVFPVNPLTQQLTWKQSGGQRWPRATPFQSRLSSLTVVTFRDTTRGPAQRPPQAQQNLRRETQRSSRWVP